MPMWRSVLFNEKGNLNTAALKILVTLAGRKCISACESNDASS